jgi:hypothetical protein
MKLPKKIAKINILIIGIQGRLGLSIEIKEFT